MRICIPIHSFVPGGVERMALRLAESWQAAGEDVAVVLGRDRGAARDQAPALNYVTRPEPFSTAAWETPWLIWCLWRYLRANPADVLFCPGNTYTIICVAIKLLLGRRCPPVLVKISNDLDRRDSNPVFRILYHRWLRIQAALLENFVAMGPGAEAEIARRLPRDRGITATIYNPTLAEGDIAVAAADELRMSGSARSFVAVGRLEPQKNFPLLLDAFAAARRSDDKLTIIGEGAARARLERQIAALGLQDSVTLTGFLPDAPERMRGHDALILSSDYEGLGSVVIEALARGVPVIATDCSSTTRSLLGASDFGPAPHGWLVPIRDAGALADAIRNFDPAGFDRDSALKLARQFTLAAASERYLEVFGRLMEHGRDTPAFASD